MYQSARDRLTINPPPLGPAAGGLAEVESHQQPDFPAPHQVTQGHTTLPPPSGTSDRSCLLTRLPLPGATPRSSTTCRQATRVYTGPHSPS